MQSPDYGSSTAEASSEAQAAHIWSTASGGPDVVQNGIALSATVHWLFDRHLISLTDDYWILVSHNKVPSELRTLLCHARWTESICRRMKDCGRIRRMLPCIVKDSVPCDAVSDRPLFDVAHGENSKKIRNSVVSASSSSPFLWRRRRIAMTDNYVHHPEEEAIVAMLMMRATAIGEKNAKDALSFDADDSVEFSLAPLRWSITAKTRPDCKICSTLGMAP